MVHGVYIISEMILQIYRYLFLQTKKSLFIVFIFFLEKSMYLIMTLQQKKNFSINPRTILSVQRMETLFNPPPHSQREHLIQKISFNRLLFPRKYYIHFQIRPYVIPQLIKQFISLYKQQITQFDSYKFLQRLNYTLFL